MNFIVSLQSLIKAFVMSHKYMTKVINKSVICSIAHLFLLQIMLFTKLMLGLELLTHSQFTTENTVIPLRSKLNVTKDRKNKQRNKNKKQNKNTNRLYYGIMYFRMDVARKETPLHP